MSKRKPPTTTLPPPRGREPVDWTSIAAQVRAAKGEWVLAFEQDRRSLANAARQGSISVLPTTEFEFATRENTIRESDGRRVCDLYIRLVD